MIWRLGFLMFFVKVLSLCPYSCICRTKMSTVICNGRRGKVWTMIPPLPENTTTLKFEYNFVENLTRNSFVNVRNIRLKEIKFLYCKIRRIEATAFSDLSSLEALELTGNTDLKTTEVANSLYSLSKSSLKSLSINHMLWASLPNDMFRGLELTNITSITIAFSRLKFLNGDLYNRLKSLKHLNLSWNGISKCDFKGFHELETLRLNRNWMNFVPDFCNSNLTSSLRVLDLQYTKIQTLRRQIQCLDKLEELNLSGLTLRLLYDNTFAQLPSLKILRMENLGSGLNTIRPNTFNSTSLIQLTFSTRDQFTFKKSRHFFPNDVLKNCPNLRYLDISYNKIHLTHKDLVNMFIHVKNIEILKMKHMLLEAIPQQFFSLFPNLTELYLDDNRITHWKRDVPFQNMTSLKVLSLTFNRISVINKTSFPINFLNGTLETMLLYGNPFSCTCDLMWFRNWMKSTNISLIDGDKFQCAVSKGFVRDYNPTPDICPPKNIVIPIVASLCSVIVVGFFTSLIIYSCRWRIRYQFYKMKSRYKEYQLLEDEDHFVYDSYVIYCEEDLAWITNVLIPKVEGEQGFRLCLHDRDFQFGGIFADQMFISIRESRTVIVVLSNAFAKDNWCQFQLAVARDVEIESGTFCLIPVLLSEIEFKFVNETVYNFLSRVNYLSWNLDNAAQDMFWLKMLDLLKKNR